MVRAVVVVVAILLVPRLVSALCTINATAGDVVLTRDDPLRIDPPPTLLETVLGDIGIPGNGDTVHVRCATGNGEYELVRRPPLFRTRRVRVQVTDPVPAC